MQTKIIYEDEQVLVCHKPSGLATQSAKVGQPDMVSELKKYLVFSEGAKGAKHRSGMTKGAAPYLGIVHRLDQPVEGLLVFAKTKEAAGKLTAQLSEGTLNKQYYAVVCGKPSVSRGELVDYLVKEGNTAKISTALEKEAKKAVLQYDEVKSLETDNQEVISLLDVHIETGRFHQIRVQLSHAGFPILGDIKYGSEESVMISKNLRILSVALFAYQLEFTHPVTKERLNFVIEPQMLHSYKFLI